MKILKKRTLVQLLTRKASKTIATGNEAILYLGKDESDKVFIKYAGSNRNLIAMTGTLMKYNYGIAAIICLAAKEYIEGKKQDPNAWMELTSEINELIRERNENGKK
jgi:hypothetical protein